MTELLLPGVPLLIVPSTSPMAKLSYRVAAVVRDHVPIALDTHATNDVVEHLLRHKRIRGLQQWTQVRRECQVGASRFDFLLRRGGEDLLLEVKSCTLFGERLAMFPDAPTQRGARHVRELAALTRRGTRGAVLFLVHWDRARYFLPDYHTDPHFASALTEARKRIDVHAVAVSWNSDLSLGDPVRNLGIPWGIAERENHDRGCYLLVLRLSRDRRIRVGKLGTVAFRRGYYVYVGSALQHLGARIARHRRLRKKLHWHIDHLRRACDLVACLPIRTSDDLECDLAQSVSCLTGWSVPRFGSSDCGCASHLFGVKDNPFHRRGFIRLVQHYRMDRLVQSPGSPHVRRAGDRNLPAEKSP
jgi:sugar fermentation stimulation protein A